MILLSLTLCEQDRKPGHGRKEDMATDDDEPEVDHKVYTTFIRLAFTPYAIHFKSPKYMKEETLKRIDTRVVKETLRLTGLKSYIRTAIGTNRPFWEELVGVFRAAVTSLERRSFQQWDPSSVDYETTSSTLIASAYPGLYLDLERLNDLVAIARNVLTAGQEVQDLCAECGFDQQMFRVVNCCVRVTARGYDGDAGTGDEERWQAVVGAYKKLLITSLQFLNNLSARNEKRKLLLWMSLFDNGDHPGTSRDNDTLFTENELEDDEFVSLIMAKKPQRSLSDSDTYRAAQKMGDMSLADSTAKLSRPNDPWDEFLWGDQLSRGAFRLLVRSVAPRWEGSDFDVEEVGRGLRESWTTNMNDMERDRWRKRYQEHLEDGRRFAELQESACMILDTTRDDPAIKRLAAIERDLHRDLKGSPDYRGRTDMAPPSRSQVNPEPIDNFKVWLSAMSAKRQLQAGKDDFMKRIKAVTSPEQQAPKPPPLSDDDSEEEDDEEEEEEEYHGSTEDGRGLLTDVPLILGPSEIEILPNMIMSGLVPQVSPEASEDQANAIIDMHTQRCHLLLAQENGRNLLRELLIFVAAWDLREEELYFKFMVKILESILVNGYLPYAYHAFREYDPAENHAVFRTDASGSYSKSRSKDIISPAQAVIMKLLTNIFRARAEASKNVLLATGQVQEPSAVEVHVVNFIFMEFRRRIVPQTCALIFLQGKIHDNVAPPEEFPLNLWDMERMYEGVYQYLEFFAVLTEEQSWKDIMAKWQVASELVTMLKELEVAIPKLHAMQSTVKIPAYDPETLFEEAAKVLPAITGAPKSGPQSKAQTAKGNTQAPPPLAPPPPLNVPGEHNLPPAPVDEQATYPDEAQDEPSDFEWRNLKKLTVLVLSSLIWKNKTVQDQVRQYGGLEALVGCCRHDEHNPYIREHAIMCLRFAVEGNAENADVIGKMAKQFQEQLALKGGSVTTLSDTSSAAPNPVAEVPKEVLDTQGYETFMDGKGQVGLRRKDMPPALAMKGSAALQAAAAQAIQGAIAGTHGFSAKDGKVTTKMAAERATQLIQNALQELPLPATLDKDSREVIARLNRAALEHVDLVAPGGSGQGKK
ncbi:putative copper transport protein [Elsinoe fawcettii]|nr:putative copper transport protein [Elsinoe fawcettii]